MRNILIEFNTEQRLYTFGAFLGTFSIINRTIFNLADWNQFLTECKLPVNYELSYAKNGCDLALIKTLDAEGFIPDSECYSLEAYYIDEQVFITESQDQITSGAHITKAWQLLADYIEQKRNCLIYIR